MIEDVQTLGSMLKCAGNLNQFDVVERVWKWSQPMRKHRLDGGGGKDCDVALVYTQFVTLCGQNMVMLTKCWKCGMNGVNQQLEEETTHFTVKYFVVQ